MPRWTEQRLREVVTESDSFSEVLRRFELRAAGSNFRQLHIWLRQWEIPTDHFTHGGDRLANVRRPAAPLEQVLVEHSTYKRDKLKQRLYETGLKSRRCELCGQGEDWYGSRMGLILDHINGVYDDNRPGNLRIVCPNCNATLATHCGRNRPSTRAPKACELCGEEFRPKYGAQLYCSRICASRVSQRSRRRVERPPYEQLLEEIATSSWSAVGRKYGVSCNAVRKWVQMEQQLRAEAVEAEREGAAEVVVRTESRERRDAA